MGTLRRVIDLAAQRLEVGVVEYGARLAVVRTPDRDGVLADVVLGLDDYSADTAFLGATVGRFANRIDGGTFELDGRRYTVPCNEGEVALHGGPDAFDHRDFTADPVVDADGARSVTLRRTSPDGENGFPGTLEVAVTYRVCGAELSIEHTARTDAPTVVNLTNHAYWNLAGGGTVEDHVLHLPASAFVAVDDQLIPAGIAPVEGTPMDFRTPLPIGSRLRAATEQLRHARGYDHAWVVDGSGLRLAARVTEPSSGRALEVLTDQPGVQFYSGNFLDGSAVGRGGRAWRQGDGLCLETQHLPDSPNQPDFPSTVLRPGDRYATTTLFRFGTSAGGR